MKVIKLYDVDLKKAFAMQKAFQEEENGFVNVTFGYDYEQFVSYVENLRNCEKGNNLPEGFVAYSVYVLVNDEEEYVGIFNLRHELNDFLRNGPGHIGYGITKEHRKKGYASKGLAIILKEAQKRGIKEVYLSANLDNQASLKVQLANGAKIHHQDDSKYYTRIQIDAGNKGTALLVIDTQKQITNKKLYQFALFEKNIVTLLSEARKNNIEVVYVQHDDKDEQALCKGTEGYEIYDAFQPMKGEKIFEKTVNSAFKDSELLSYLNAKGINRVILVGLQTDYCIDANVKIAFEHGLEVIVPAYANTTVDNEFMSKEQSYHYYNDFIWPNRYAKCCSIEEVIRQIREQ